MLETLGALIVKAGAAIATALTNIILAWGCTFLAFMMIPGLRKLAYIVPGILASAMVGYITNQVGQSWNWAEGTTNVVSSVLGFFTMAGLMVFSKVHDALTVDDSVVALIVEKIKSYFKVKPQ